MEPLQWLLVWPLVTFLPSRRRAIMRGWLRLQARFVLALARRLAGIRLSVRGAIAPTSCIVVMNHQSLLDIPLGISLIRGPYPLIPTRASYRRGIPGISTLTRLGRHPLVTQGRTAGRAELEAFLAAAGEVAEGKQSFLIFPEGHRSRNGDILPFMSTGLTQVLGRAGNCPVYAVVVDGLWPVRTFSDIALRLAGTTVRAQVLGPYTIPPQREKLRDFVQFLRSQMIETLARLRDGSPETLTLVARPQPAR
jgi:1-acyl-sn-glycerol-3-phosphate acyltransferase